MDLSILTRVGLDETSKSKGHNYVTCFVDMDQKKTVYVAEGKDNKTVIEFVDDLKNHQGSPENITDVSSDMSPAFIKGIHENLPNASITFDRFHLMQFIMMRKFLSFSFTLFRSLGLLGSFLYFSLSCRGKCHFQIFFHVVTRI